MGSQMRREHAEPAGLSAMTTPADRIARLAMDARHHLERRDLYRSKEAGPDAVTAERMMELERTYEVAAERLAAAEAEQPQDSRGRLTLVAPTVHGIRPGRDELPVKDFDKYSPDFVEPSLRAVVVAPADGPR
jgi:hypothetical protein